MLSFPEYATGAACKESPMHTSSPPSKSARRNKNVMQVNLKPTILQNPEGRSRTVYIPTCFNVKTRPTHSLYPSQYHGDTDYARALDHTSNGDRVAGVKKLVSLLAITCMGAYPIFSTAEKPTKITPIWSCDYIGKKTFDEIWSFASDDEAQSAVKRILIFRGNSIGMKCTKRIVERHFDRFLNLFKGVLESLTSRNQFR